jgi:DNA-binding transcriptional LysR family regulator
MFAIEDLQLAAALLRESSLSAAARALDVTPPALSMRLRRLEAELGLSLANRSARRLALTPEGERFGREAARLLAQMEELRDALRHDDQQLGGTLRIAAPFGYGRRRLAQALVPFARQHPQLRLQLDLRETPFPDRHDADAVVHIGEVRDSSWVARVLAANDRWLCASPDYLRRHGMPQAPRELLEHRCICIRENEEDVTLWHLRPAARHTAPGQTLRVTPGYVTNDGGVARRWAEQGLGLVLRSQWDMEEAIDQGRLVRVLQDWHFGSAPITLLVPTRKGRTARVQALVGFLQQCSDHGTL